MRYLYYPGCSQKSSSISYDRSFLAVCQVLGIELQELLDWNCCGATIAISVNRMVSLFLAARNLGLANQARLPLVTPCPSCYVAMKRVQKLCQENKLISERISHLLAEEELSVSGSLEVCHSLDFLVRVAGLEAIGNKVRNPLSGIKIAPYYGCQLSGPHANGNTDGEPGGLESLIEVLGAEPVEFPFRTQCCGGSLMFTSDKQAKKLSSIILESVHNTDAGLIVTPCGLCQLNLQIATKNSPSWNSRPAGVPVLNIGQLMGLAFDLGKGKIFLKKNRIMASRKIITEIN